MERLNTDWLIAILEESKRLISLPENDFSWSSWEDAEDARREIDGVLSTLRSGESPNVSQMQVLFAPTGPMQEVALSSGWGDAFLDLVSRFDAAIA